MNKTIIGKAGGCAPLARPLHQRIPVSGWVSGLILLALLSLVSVRPAMAAQAHTAHFMVSVQVVHDCQYQIKGQPQTPSVVHVDMQGCPGQPRILAHGFVAGNQEKLPGRDATRYLLRETHHASTARNRYIEIDF